jgi:hypothetical protein
MALGTGIFLVALGAILRYAISDAIDGVELATVGLILMLAGAAGIVLSFLWAAMARNRAVAAPVDGTYDPRYDQPPTRRL